MKVPAETLEEILQLFRTDSELRVDFLTKLELALGGGIGNRNKDSWSAIAAHYLDTS